MNATVTTIIVNYRLAAGAIRAAESVLAEGMPGAVWVVDNSEDPAEAAALQGALGDRCRLLISAQNRGFGAACNEVYTQTDSEFVFLLNPDAFCEPGALPALVTCLEHNARAGGVTPRTWLDAGHVVLMPFLYLYPWWHPLLAEPLSRPVGLGLWVWSLGRRAEALRLWQAQQPQRLARSGLGGGHVLLRRRAVDQAGGLFDPRFFLYGEDTDLSLRLRAAGWELWQAPAAQVVHTFGSTARDRAEWKHQQAVRAEQQLLAKHHGDNRRLRWLRRVDRRLPGRPWLPRSSESPKAASWAAPAAWQDGWLLEIGMNPFLIPAVGVLGSGATATLPECISASVPPGIYWVRLGPARPGWLTPAVTAIQISAGMG